KPSAEFQDRHGRGGREIRGLTVEEYINRLGQNLIPLAERSARVMREALAALEATRAVPSNVVERSKPISLSIRWKNLDVVALAEPAPQQPGHDRGAVVGAGFSAGLKPGLVGGLLAVKRDRCGGGNRG